MPNRILMGFQNTVDFELAWEPDILEELIRHHQIYDREIRADIPISCERDILLVLLSHMKAGSGCECGVSSSAITRAFASHFPYQITLGGTAVRAAIALSLLGTPSTIHACSLNQHFRDLIPDAVKWVASVPDEGEDFHPHVIVQYPLHARICVNDIDICTHRPNRVIFAHDPPSTLLKIDPSFAAGAENARVFLAASYNTMSDVSLLKDRLQTTIDIVNELPRDCVAVMEDAYFASPEIRRVVTETLSPHLRIFSMNEDELQDRIGRRINILDPDVVAGVLETVYQQIGTPILVVHSAYWALAYGRNPGSVAAALKGGILMASTRFRKGDVFNIGDYRDTEQLPDRQSGVAFAQKITAMLGEGRVCCIPCKDLDSVEEPTTIGLGDAFVGGMLPGLMEISCCCD